MTQLEAMALSWLLELPIAVLVTRRSDRRFLLCVVAVTLVTHPGMWWIGSLLPLWAWWPGMCLTEAVLSVVEGLLLWRLSPLSIQQGILCGVCMNAFSFALGLLL